MTGARDLITIGSYNAYCIKKGGGGTNTMHLTQRKRGRERRGRNTSNCPLPEKGILKVTLNPDSIVNFEFVQPNKIHFTFLC